MWSLIFTKRAVPDTRSLRRLHDFEWKPRSRTLGRSIVLLSSDASKSEAWSPRHLVRTGTARYLLMRPLFEEFAIALPAEHTLRVSGFCFAALQFLSHVRDKHQRSFNLSASRSGQIDNALSFNLKASGSKRQQFCCKHAAELLTSYSANNQIKLENMLFGGYIHGSLEVQIPGFPQRR